MPSKIQTVYGNVLDFTENAVMIHGCNCQGVMGSGVALAVKEKYPEVFVKYYDLCATYDQDERFEFLLGSIQPISIVPNYMIINAFTQFYFGTTTRHVNYEALVSSFEETNKLMNRLSTELTLYFPKIGAGLGGGNWEIIKTIIEQTVDQKFNPTLVEFSG